ncbi:MAG TPA: tetratricopeptide repeat protein [Methylomirabilota bacterium]|nr:tetratricopeptide repeat protein [Methylomirabilota bacterium]
MRAAGARLALALTLLTGGCSGSMTEIAPGERPPLHTDEGDLWMEMDRLEQQLRTSGVLVRDADLTSYVRDAACRVAGPRCEDIRVYVVRSPGFNASMAPNGMMQVWTGLLLRVQNEAELAYVLGHEIGHYVRRHSLQAWRDARSKANVVSFLSLTVGLAGAVVGGGAVGSAAAGGSDLAGRFAALASMNAFSRDNEREADLLGVEAMIRTGYDPRQAPKILERLLEEQAAAKASGPSIFFATHPPTEERIASLRERAERAAAVGGPLPAGAERFLARTLHVRSVLLNDELRRRQYEAFQVLLNQLERQGMRLGELTFFQGELYRLRGESGDEARAIDSYRRALALPDAPPEAQRNLGLLLTRSGDRGAARAALERYLQAQPEAEDRAMIRAHLERLK